MSTFKQEVSLLCGKRKNKKIENIRRTGVQLETRGMSFKIK